MSPLNQVFERFLTRTCGVMWKHAFIEPCSWFGFRYSQSLRSGRSGDRIPVWATFFHTRPYWPWDTPSLIYSGSSKRFPLQAWSGSWGSRRLRLLNLLDFRHYEGGNVVTLTYRPSLPPGVFLILIVRGWVVPRAHDSISSYGKNPQRHHWGSIPRPSD
jgi:hypothetical protein